MPRKRKRSVSPPRSAIEPTVKGGGGMDEGRNDIPIQQSSGSVSQPGRSNPRSIHEHDAIISPRQRHRHSPPTHSPHYQPQTYYEQQQQRNHTYSPQAPNSNTQHPSYHHSNHNQTHRNSPDREEPPPHSSYSPQNQSSSNQPPNPHAPSHYNFANRAYAQQRDSGFNTFRVNTGPVPGPVAGGGSSVPPVGVSIPSNASPLPTPSFDYQHQRQDEDSFQYRFRPHSHSQPPATTASTSIPGSYPRLSPPLSLLRDNETENEFGSAKANGSGVRNRSWRRNGGESSLSSSDEDDVPYNPATAGGRSKVMVKYLIMKAKYRYVLDEHALLADELESLKREEHEQWTLKEVSVDEIIKSFGSDSDRFLHDRDQHAQQYQLHHDHDSTDGDLDLLRDLDKERHAFLNRDRGPTGDHERKEYIRDVGSDSHRGRDHYSNHHIRSVDLDSNGNEDTVRIPSVSNNALSSIPGSSRDNNRQSERRRQRSSSRSRLESGLDSYSYPYSRHSYRRTPPLPSTSEREHSSQAQQSLFQQDRQYVPEQRVDTGDGLGQDGQRYVSSPHPHQYPPHANVNVHRQGLISPPSSQHQSRYQSPPLPLQQRPPQPRTPPPISPHQYRESPERRRSHEESFQPQHEYREHSNQGGQGSVYGSNAYPVNDEHHAIAERETRTSENIPSSSRPRHHDRSSPHISHSSHSPDADPNSQSRSFNNRRHRSESSRERAFVTSTRPKRGRPSLEESAREREFENPMDTRGLSSTQMKNLNPAIPAQFESGRQYSPSPSQQFKIGSPSPSQRSITPQPSRQTQMQRDSMQVTSVPDQQDPIQSKSRRSSATSLHSSQLQSPPPGSTPSSRSVKVSQVGSPPLRTPLLAATLQSVNPNFSPSIPNLSRTIHSTPPPPPSLRRPSHTPPPHRLALHSPLQQKDVTTINDGRALQVEERESSNEAGRTLERGSGMDVD
ncbi:hypothetical protein Clacol_008483 [Clathrus columnatus]|uniref:Uncharacterized protein n=1 Tax=Clathrus columnatus TaxID=1419009 RepID=A0AAV5AHV8_9AGAM|nr:hypothetical protein Clacol_008483 [Clathrus columnatus]